MKPLDRRFNCTMTLFRASAACIAALAGVRGVAVNAQDRLDGARPSMDEIMVTGTRSPELAHASARGKRYETAASFLIAQFGNATTLARHTALNRRVLGAPPI